MKPIYKAILFDLDGVLIDACDWHRDALNMALEAHNLPAITPHDHEHTYNGLPTLKKLEAMGIKEPMKSSISALKKQYTNEFIQSRCFPDKDKIALLKLLKKAELKIACCSNSIHESIERMLSNAHILEYFDLILGNDDVIKPKPDPQIYTTAMAVLGVTPQECLIVEDAPHGVAAAKASGGNVIVVSGYRDVTKDLVKEYL